MIAFFPCLLQIGPDDGEVISLVSASLRLVDGQFQWQGFGHRFVLRQCFE